jgi:hypothetical protein
MKEKYEELQKKYEEIIELKKLFNDKVYDLVDIKEKLDGYKGRPTSIEKIYYGKDEVEVEVYEPAGCGCCPGDTYYYTFDLEDLFDIDGYKEKTLKKIKEKEEIKKKEEEAAKEKVRLEKEERDKKEYERLQKKYGEK